MENREFTSQVEYDGSTLAMDLVESAWKTVAGLIAEPGKENTIYSLDISIMEKSPEILAHLIKNLINEIQKTRETYFILDIKVPKDSSEEEYIKLANTLKNESYIDSYRVIQTKNSTERHIHLICE
mgnify:CR=1 FL=1